MDDRRWTVEEAIARFMAAIKLLKETGVGVYATTMYGEGERQAAVVLEGLRWEEGKLIESETLDADGRQEVGRR